MLSNPESPILNLTSAQEYHCTANLNLYDSPECTTLSTQAASGRHLRITLNHQLSAFEVYLCEDDYRGWVSFADLDILQPATTFYQAKSFSQSQITKLLPNVINFTQKSMEQSNYYLWGGTVGPNYDCSGLMQAAFFSVGIWLPRDAYQQEAFTHKINVAALQPGDLVFFGNVKKATHVGLYLGYNSYIHSSGKDQGRNGIGIDILSEQGDRVSQSYYHQMRGAGRVIQSYQPYRN